MDFTYLYDEGQDDFIEFTGGKPIPAKRVFKEIGRPEEWTYRTSDAARLRTVKEVRTVAEQLTKCRHWEDLLGSDDGREYWETSHSR